VFEYESELFEAFIKKINLCPNSSLEAINIFLITAYLSLRHVQHLCHVIFFI